MKIMSGRPKCPRAQYCYPKITFNFI